MFEAKKPDIPKIARSLTQLGLQLDGIASIANTLVKVEKPQPAVKEVKKSQMISPSTPFLTRKPLKIQ
jgi:hypothetical protein